MKMTKLALYRDNDDKKFLSRYHICDIIWSHVPDAGEGVYQVNSYNGTPWGTINPYIVLKVNDADPNDIRVLVKEPGARAKREKEPERDLGQVKPKKAAVRA